MSVKQSETLKSILLLSRTSLAIIRGKGPVKIYGTTGPGNMQRDQQLFCRPIYTGPTTFFLFLWLTDNGTINFFFHGKQRDQQLFSSDFIRDQKLFLPISRILISVAFEFLERCEDF